MSRSNFLTGIKSTGRPHLGNVIGVIYPTIFLTKLTKNEKFQNQLILIANLHSLTNFKYIKNNKNNAYKILAVWLACGIDYKQFIFYRQSDIPEVTELLWFFSIMYPYNRLRLVHSFKENVKKKQIINTGILTYPILMAADILISKAELVLVGKDQLQHLEIARQIAKKINNIIAKKIFPLPQAIVIENLIPGTDGTKMSKTKNNIIDLFASKKEIKKQIMKIKTQKQFEPNKVLKDNLYNIYIRLAGKENKEKIKYNFQMGYEHAKEELYKLIINKFKRERTLYKYYIKKTKKLETIFQKGAKKMKQIVNSTIYEVRKAFECN
ncbi:tryptophan--tRNA ligase [Candidatus Karelsulcia muelleri]